MIVTSTNPHTGEQLGTFEATDAVAVTEVVERARSAQRAWYSQSWSSRKALYGQLQEVLKASESEVLSLLTTEAGKVLPDAEGEFFDTIDAISYYVEAYEALVPPVAPELNAEAFPATTAELAYEPYGVTAAIMPWNFPFFTPFMTVIAATLTRNSVVLKPSEYTTGIGQKIAALLQAAGFPNDLVSVVSGGDDTGKALVKSGVDKIFFVGSVTGGLDVVKNAALKPVQLELGGNSAALVLADADLDLAVAGVAWGGTYHSGQDCAGVKRVLVAEEVAEQFLERLCSVVSALRPGVDFGPYITSEAVDEVQHRLDEATASGTASVLCGGNRFSPGNWMSPVVLRYSDSGIDLVKSETFGNVLPVKTFSTVDEAVAEANATAYGLSNSIFSRDEDLAQGVANRLESGMVFINDPLLALPGLEHWNGWKNSGFGGIESRLEQCVRKRLTTINHSGSARSFWYPYPGDSDQAEE